MRRMSFLALMLCATVAAAAPPCPKSPSEIDLIAYDVAHKAVGAGIKSYNSGDPKGCQQRYEFALDVLKSMLKQRPGLVKEIDASLAKAKDPKLDCSKACRILRDGLDTVMYTILDLTKPEAAVEPGETLWVRIGGKVQVTAFVETFLAAAADVKAIDLTVGGNYPLTESRKKALAEHLVALVSSLTGGDIPYTGRDMKNAHQGMKITEIQFNAAMALMTTQLDLAKVKDPEKKELLAVIEATRKEVVGK